MTVDPAVPTSDNKVRYDGPKDEGAPTCACGEWRLSLIEVVQGWHSRADHHPHCDGLCMQCPVEVQCGPIRTNAERNAAKEADLDAPF